MDSLTTITEAVTGACGNGGPLMGDCSIITGAPDYSLFISENIWIMISAMLVFIMGLGFACVESGLCRAKSSANICFKNIAVPAIGISVYALVGFGLMYPGEFNGILGFAGFGIGDWLNPKSFTSGYNGHFTLFSDWLFQAMFAATAATIVSGAVAERIKLSSFLVFTLLYVAFVYPIVGSWVWGGGWLSKLGFHDLAGSELVHSVGGWAALAGVIILGPRLGKYSKGKSHAIPAHNIPLATIGTFILWFGWWGFNGGSALSGNPFDTSLILVTTNLAAVAGIITATATSWILSKKPDATMALNGCLAGLVAITAGADTVTPMSSWIIGAVAGVLVVLAVFFFDRMRLDDPVGALSVHLVNGVWGTIAVGVFDYTGRFSVLTQLLGVVAYAIPCFLCASIIFLAIKKTIGLRVSEKEELRGLDLSEHGQESYGGFQIFSNT
ncbi:MAG: ammonium transporter [Hallerella porci]|uniref:Ammonium transporter n=2 Tax=Fibrobacteraceae TaxID=204431 RepID=A0ABX5LQH6_9BACT|nr:MULTISPECIES: ammonium transporter [Hallerella]MCI5600917.1 ammonium transporter [Hallerella sp.]MDY3922213.1 ammonium transporter [Hallerella porci]PWL04169.1 ammonium transporter [Hallerella porci]